jgi:isocitrate dehydrogenase kinase/phosphatase
LLQAFERQHEDLFHAEYWKSLQQRTRDGVIEDFFSYRRKQRFRQR